MKKIIFRADGNSSIGLGHLYRIFALVEIYKHSYEYIFVTKSTSTLNVIPSVYPYSLVPEKISTEEEPNWLREHFNPTNHILMVDGYQFNELYQLSIKKAGYQLVYIDDLIKGHQYADIVINHSLSVKASDYESEPYTRFAIGTEYAILRPAFTNAAKQYRIIKAIDTAFVCFGGADSIDLTYKTTCGLLNFNEITTINIVLGGAYLHKEIFELKKTHSRVKIYQNLNENELLSVMAASNIGITPASTVLYELCCVKMPVLSGYYVDNQKGIYKGCYEHGCIYGGGDFSDYSASDFESRIRNIISETDYSHYTNAQSKLFDSKIAQRFLALLSPVTYRTATEADMELIFNWSNEKTTRANSYFSEPIQFENHKVWFSKKLNDSNCCIYIAEFEGVPAGMVRYETGPENTVVGVIVNEYFRGKGLAVVFLRETSDLYFSAHSLPILAYIKKENEPSIKSFIKAGYSFHKDELVHGAESVVYKLEKKHV